MLTALCVLIMLAVGYAHLRDGTFTALCMLVNTVLAGLVAFWLFEPFADWLAFDPDAGLLLGRIAQ